MVTLSKIYTKTGDGGLTRLGDNSQVDKTDIRVEAYGCVDELNAVLGLAMVDEDLSEETKGILTTIQNDLFDLGADLCCPMQENEEEGQKLRVRARQVEFVEGLIDRFNEGLAPLRSFVLPGGTPLAARFHFARTVCRRAERCVWKLQARDSLNEQVAIYLNRLSDLFFVWSRYHNGEGRDDVLWQPGRGAEESK
ncbi:MAG: cob(I)alamin adenosyltransferase [Candidatus Latescibacterota bacterium]|jgi:cob(I)alamin adenosyltransferase